MTGPFRLHLPPDLLDAAVAHARAERPNECCGLFAGRIDAGVGRVTLRLPLVNEWESPVAFRSEPRSMLTAHKAMRSAGLELLAVYHSHPTSPPVPSRHDLAERYADDVACVIISLAGNAPEVRAWWLDAEGYREAEWA
jgi:proteasome lid subunit RPN8/RPN11